MRRGRLLILIGLLLLLGVGAVFVFLNVLGGGAPEEAATPEAGPTAIPEELLPHIVIAVQDLRRGTKIVEDAIALVPWPPEQLPPTAITATDTVVGFLARRDILRGEPILSSLVVEDPLDVADIGSDWALYIPDGMVAMTIPAPRLTGAFGSNLLRDGDHVNVIVSFSIVDLDEEFQTALPNMVVPINILGVGGGAAEGAAGGGEQGAQQEPFPYGRIEPLPGEPGGLFPFYVFPSESTPRPRLVSQQIIQDAIVLGVGAFVAPEEAQVVEPTAVPDPNVPPTATPEGGPPPPTPVPPPETITLMVSPQDAVALTYFIHTPSKFTLTLRAPDDASVADTEAVTLSFVVEKYRITIPTPLPYAMEPRITRIDVPSLSTAPVPEFVTLPPPDTEYLCIGVNCP